MSETQKLRCLLKTTHWKGCLLLAPVVRYDAFFALVFCMAAGRHVHFPPRLSCGFTLFVGAFLESFFCMAARNHAHFSSRLSRGLTFALVGGWGGGGRGWGGWGGA